MASPAINGLSDNLARQTRVRDARVANSLDIHRAPTRAIGGPAVDPAWDAFFGGMQETEDTARAAGLGFRAKFGSFGRPATSGSAPLAGLRKAMQ